MTPQVANIFSDKAILSQTVTSLGEVIYIWPLSLYLYCYSFIVEKESEQEEI